jgi:hypothetical protein
MKKILITLAITFAFVALLSFALAANSEPGVMKANSEKVLRANESARNLTYGQCVTIGVEAKNNCYESVKSIKSSCDVSARNSTELKSALKTCNSAYKNSKAECKKSFKSVKNECKKVKHNFFETARYAFA